MENERVPPPRRSFLPSLPAIDSLETANGQQKVWSLISLFLSLELGRDSRDWEGKGRGHCLFHLYLSMDRKMPLKSKYVLHDMCRYIGIIFTTFNFQFTTPEQVLK